MQFNDVELPLENLVIRDHGLKRLMSAFNTQRCLNPAICLGLAEGALEASLRYLRERSAFGHPIGDFQGLRWKAADMYIQIEAARVALTRHVKRGGKVWLRVFPDHAYTKKPAETRMGKGKGAPEYYIVKIKPGRVIFEMGGIPEELARSALRLCAHKIPFPTKFITRTTGL